MKTNLFKNKTFHIFFIFILVFISYANIFQNQFVLDDYDFIVDWPLIRDWNNFPNFFINYTPPPGEEGIYSPLKTVFHALNYHMFELKPLGYHMVSLLIHFCGIFFVYEICLLLTTNALAAFISALLFGLHPVQVEAITYMTASIDMIGIVFLFVAFYCYIKFRGYQGAPDSRMYFMSLIFALFAIFTHELAISLPVLFVWYDFCFGRGLISWRKAALRVLPFFVIVGVYVLCKYLVLGSIARGTYLFDNFYLTMLVMIKAWMKYVFICVAPIVLTYNHKIAQGISSFDFEDFDRVAVLTQSPFDPQVILALALMSGIFYYAWKHYRDKPLITFCIGWFFISLLPVSNIIPSNVFFGERYLYPGLLGFCLLCGLGIGHLYRREGSWKWVSFSSMAVVLVLLLTVYYSLRTWVRNKDWRNEVSFVGSAVNANPQSGLLRADLGLAYIGDGQISRALGSLEESLKRRPDYAPTYFLMAEAYVQSDRRPKAIEALKQAISLDEDFGEAHYNLAGLYAVEGMKNKAEVHLNASMKLYRKQGKYREADELEQAFRSYFQ